MACRFAQPRVNLDETAWQRVKEVAREQDRSASSVLRMFVERGLREYERQQRERQDAA